MPARRTIRRADLPVALRFLTPPEDQGQVVEVSYAGTGDGRVLRCAHDRATRRTEYAIADLSAREIERCDPIGLNDTPEIDGDWAPVHLMD